MTVFCFSDTTTVNPVSHDGISPIPLNVDPATHYRIMLDVDDTLPSPRISLVLSPPVRER